MNKKILVGSILVVLMLVMISYATAVNTTTVEKKESPLYKIRVRYLTNENFNKIIESIKTKFIGNRIFFLPYILLIKNVDDAMRYRLVTEEKGCPEKGTIDLPCSLPQTIPTVPEQETCGWHKTCMWLCQ